MASLGHVAVGMFAGRIYNPQPAARAVLPMVLFSGLALLPDLDYLGVVLGVPNVGPCGHRGASHSLVLPLMVGAMLFAAAPAMRLPRWRTAIFTALVTASHSLLD